VFKQSITEVQMLIIVYITHLNLILREQNKVHNITYTTYSGLLNENCI